MLACRGRVGICFLRLASPLMVARSGVEAYDTLVASAAKDARLLISSKRFFADKGKRGKRKFAEPVVVKHTKSTKPVVDVYSDMTAIELSEALNVELDAVVEALVELDKLNLDLVADGKPLDQDHVLKIVALFNCKPRLAIRHLKKNEGEAEDVLPQPPPDPKDCVKRPPIVTIMGHVDHGKTTLLDALRNSHIVDGEFGGITQHIGAFSGMFHFFVFVCYFLLRFNCIPSDSKTIAFKFLVDLRGVGRRVTFLDTPGHAAFAAMRARGAKGADIVVLVVAADDGVKEQTIQSIKFAQSAGVPIVVAINKCDKPTADPVRFPVAVEFVPTNVQMRAKRSLLEHNIVPEDLGGDVQCVEISALHAKNLPALQEALLTQAEMMDLKSTEKGLAEGIVIESSVIQGLGKVCTIVMTRGILRKSAILVAGKAWSKVRTMTNESGKDLQEAGPSTPVRISGWREDLPNPGEIILEVSCVDRAHRAIKFRTEREMAGKAEKDRKAIEEQRMEERAKYLANRQKMLDALRTDVEGTLEAILNVTETYASEKCKFQVVEFGVGPPTNMDVEIAKETGGSHFFYLLFLHVCECFNFIQAVIYLFNVQPSAAIKQQAERDGVRIEQFNVIYRLVESLKNELSSQLPRLMEMELVGEGHVLKEFLISDRARKKQPIAGVLVDWGNFQRDCIFKFLRGGNVIYEGGVESMKHQAELVSTATTNTEVGIALEDKSIRFKEDDTVEVYKKKQVPQTIDCLMDVENARIVDGLIFGYLSRQQYYNTLRVFCNEAPSLRDSKNRLHSGGDVFIQVNDQLHDKSLEQIIHAFSAVGRFDVSPELIDFGVRLRHLTNEFSTMTAMRGRSLSDNQIKLYGKKAYSKMHPSRPSLSNSSLCANNSETSACRSTMYCVPPNSSEAEYVRQLHDNAVNASVEHAAQPQSASQQDLGYDYQVQAQSTQNIPCFQSTHLLPSAQQSNVAEEHMLVDVGVNVKNTENLECFWTEKFANFRPSGEERFDGSRAQISSSFCSETVLLGAHKRKAGVPHRRGDLVAHTAQSLIVPNGVLLDLESEAAASTTSQVSLLSNIDDSAMQCLDRLINGNLDEVFPFCDDHDGLSEFAASLDNPYAPSQSNDNDIEQESNVMCGEAILTPLDVPAANSPLPREPASKNRSFDEGEIISDESNHAKTPKTSCGENIQTRVEERAPSPTLTSNDSRRSSLDSGRNRREEKRIADRLKEFNRNPPKPETRKSNAERVDRDTAVQESKGVPRSSPTPSSGRTSRDRVRRFSALFDEGHSATPSRDSSPHHERLSKKEEERRRREKEMEKERQRDKERLRKQRRDRETQRDRERSHRPSPERKTSEKRSIRGDDDGKNRESKDRERKRDPGEERKAVDEVERKKSDEKFRRDMLKKKKEEELETKRQAEQQRRAEAMRRKEEENKRRREERERQEEKRREEERQQKLREERIRREEEKALKRQEEEETRKAEEREDDRSQSKDEEEEEEVVKDDGEQSAEYRESEDDAASDDQHTARNYPDEEEGVNRKTSSTQDQWVHPRKIEQKRNNDNSAGRKVDGEVQQENDQDSVTTSENEEKRKKSTREEHQSLKNPIDIRKSLPLPCVPPRRDTVKKAPAKPLEPGMMMTDPGVLDRINKEMESLTPRNRTSHTRSAEESATSSKSTTSSTRIPKRDVPVDYAQVLFSNAPVIKRTPPAVEKKRNLVISSGLTTEYSNQLVFSKAHSSRLGMFLEKASEKHRRLMIERDYDSDAMSPFYEDPDRNDARSPFEVPHCPRQQSQKFVPQKRPLPAASLDSYLGSPVQSSPDIDGESSSQRSTSKKPKIDLSRMPDIIEKLYSNK
ncbi:putative translation initiation factor IF-2 [Necator americanus]|uniref:Putative translation initiation factor IF-2 n=1 Tax=Necator americanus TaxID=51031 RepID=W2SS00_NECAM|nr:putative translation initiation factor IF-2 [Necator americanus]ETN72395.1 putative translation initiation factor IF-2 [Necator americanus]